MRIVHVLHSHGYGGAEHHALVLMKGLRDAGHEVLYAGPADSWLTRECQSAGIQTRHLAMSGLFDVASHWRLRRLLRQWQADVVHGHLVRGAFYAGWAAAGVRPCVAIATAHATTAHKHMGRCAGIIAVSKAVAQNLLRHGHPPGKVTVVYNGMPDVVQGERRALRQELGIPEDAFAVVNVGRFIRDKGQDLLVQALGKGQGGWHLYLVGDPQNAFGQEVRRQAHGMPHVHFLGYRPDVHRILPAFDLYALSSRREALGLSLVEASAAALPIVATRVGGVPEVVIEGRTGLLVPSEDAAAMAQAIEGLRAAPGRAEALGHAARQHYLAMFTVPQMVEGTLAVYAMHTASASHKAAHA